MNMIKRILKLLYYKIKYRKNNVKISPGCNIRLGTTFEGNNIIGKKTTFSGSIGYGSYMGANCVFSGKIGRYCSIADNVRVVTGTHPTKDFVSTHPCFYSPCAQGGFTYVKESRFDELRMVSDEYNVVVGNDVWLGYGCVILSGVTIGDGAIVAAGAVITKDVNPYSIVGGVPAKFIRDRFTASQISFLLDYKWWNKDKKWIMDKVDDFNNIEKFISKYEK